MRSARPTRLLVALVAALVVLPLLTAVAVRASHGDRVLPGVRVGATDLGGADRATARRKLSAEARRRLVLVAPDRRFVVTREGAGLRLDVEATVERAMRAGRDGALLGLPATVRRLVGEVVVPQAVVVDDARLRSLVEALRADVARAARPGRVRVLEDGTLGVVEPRPGRRLRDEALLRRARAALARGRASIAVPVAETAKPSTGALEAATRRARRLVGDGLRLRAGGRVVGVPVREVVDALRLRVAGEGRVRVEAGDAALRRWVGRVAGEVDRAARPTRVRTPPATPVLREQGDVSWRPRRVAVSVREGRPGRAIRRDAAVAALRRALAEGRPALTLPMARTAAGPDVAGARRVRRLIGTFTTPFEPGQPRVTNIRRMARTIDGTVVPPGGRFSLNGATGPRTKPKGYVEAPFIADDRIVPSVGGGVSQVATTMYNAAFFAGFPIDAATPHSLYIDRYPPGREATLDFPSIDLAWRNDTAVPVVVRAAAGDAQLTVSLFGDVAGRRVRSVTGERRPVPGGDFAVTVTRVVVPADGPERREPRTTTYRREREAPEEAPEAPDAAPGATPDAAPATGDPSPGEQ